MNQLTIILKTKIPPGIPDKLQTNDPDIDSLIDTTLENMYTAIPDNKRISYGIVFTVKTLVDDIYEKLSNGRTPVFSLAERLFFNAQGYKTKSFALGLLSLTGIKNLDPVLPFFKRAAAHESFEIREMAAMFFRRLIKEYPDHTQQFLKTCAASDDPNIRRFVSETLRPVVENRWFYKQPEYSLSVLRLLFRESKPYPRTSVGNNLSDLARRCPDLVYDLVEELVKSGDKNSRWIAYRACRNLVKQDPDRVMDIFGIDEYKYKSRIYKR
ncbi:hypothetical protein JW935_25900 [candidate division KSB1 bacterium]|nr:hypothetical protein [candidate division KSB1 bacterium]